MSEIIKIVWDALKKKVGVTGTLVIAICAMGIYVATSYPKYVVTPDTLQRVSARLDLRTIELELSSLRKEKFELEDIIDVPKPKTRYIERLKEVNERIKQIDSEKKEFMKVLETK